MLLLCHTPQEVGRRNPNFPSDLILILIPHFLFTIPEVNGNASTPYLDLIERVQNPLITRAQTLNPLHRTLNPQPSTLNPQPSTLSHEP